MQRKTLPMRTIWLSKNLEGSQALRHVGLGLLPDFNGSNANTVSPMAAAMLTYGRAGNAALLNEAAVPRETYAYWCQHLGNGRYLRDDRDMNSPDM